jgi:hypothetical protein
MKQPRQDMQIILFYFIYNFFFCVNCAMLDSLKLSN